MALKTILYFILLLFGIAGSVTYHPLIGILGYLVTYNINPASQWWGVVLLSWGIRYSFFLAVATGLGIIFHGSKLKFNKLLEGQEILLIVFLGIIWLSIPLGFGFNQAESNAVKMLKIVIILLMASHIITELKYYEIMIWILIISGLYLVTKPTPPLPVFFLEPGLTVASEVPISAKAIFWVPILPCYCRLLEYSF